MNQLLLSPYTDGATFSLNRCYRYKLWRGWGNEPYCIFIGLNPSTADEQEDDPTIRRCVGFAKSWGYGGVTMLNLFAIRSTNPKNIYLVDDPVGPDHDEHLEDACRFSPLVVAAWGNRGRYRGRSQHVLNLLRPLVGEKLTCLRRTKPGAPEHPLYLPGSLRPVPYE